MGYLLLSIQSEPRMRMNSETQKNRVCTQQIGCWSPLPFPLRNIRSPFFHFLLKIFCTVISLQFFHFNFPLYFMESYFCTYPREREPPVYMYNWYEKVGYENLKKKEWRCTCRQTSPSWKLYLYSENRYIWLENQDVYVFFEKKTGESESDCVWHRLRGAGWGERAQGTSWR